LNLKVSNKMNSFKFLEYFRTYFTKSYLVLAKYNEFFKTGPFGLLLDPFY